MRKMVLLVCLFCVTASAQSADELFAAGNYAQALEKYEQSQTPDATMLLRMSQCAGMANEYAKAVLYGARLLRHTYWQHYRTIAKQIVVAQHQAGARTSVPGMWWQVRVALACIPLLVWQLLFILLWVLLLWFGRSWLQRRRSAKLAFMMISIVLMGGMNWWSFAQRRAAQVVVHERGALRAGPGQGYAQLVEVVPALMLQVIDRDTADDGTLFYKVVDADLRGWVSQNMVRVV